VRTDDRVAAYSSRGPSWYDGIAKPDILAPGHSLISNAAIGSTLEQLYPSLVIREGTTKYLKLSGSSMATAVVTGLAALMVEANASNTNEDWNQRDARWRDHSASVSVQPLSPNAIKAMLQYSATPLRSADGVAYDALTQGAGLVNGLGAVTLASAADTAKPVGTNWISAAVEPSTTFDGVVEPWSGVVVWGTRLLRGSSLVELNQPAWDENIVWGTGELDNMRWAAFSQNADGDENIVWGTLLVGADLAWFGDIQLDENIVWGTAIDWDENIVWGTGLVGFFDGENIVWGTFDEENIVWGTLLDENIVWGTWNRVTALGGAAIGGGR
jgi:subtilisin family serine protease